MSRSVTRASSRRSSIAAPAGLIILFSLACGDSTEPRRAVALGVVTQPLSNAQSGVALTQAPVVEVRDQDGAPFAQAGVSVTVSIAAGGGTLGGTTTQTTDAEGRASFPDLVISGTVGPRTLRFAADGLTAAISSSITLAAGLAATLEPVSGVTVQATVGTAVTTRPSVVVKDASGNGVPGVSVTFTGAAGSGDLTGTTQTTNSSGIATLGGWTVPTGDVRRADRRPGDLLGLQRDRRRGRWHDHESHDAVHGRQRPVVHRDQHLRPARLRKNRERAGALLGKQRAGAAWCRRWAESIDAGLGSSVAATPHVGLRQAAG